ncbi:MAG: hypothetical protein KKB34_16880 [Bacteroidetes bacterium]|nr:hypothetical protein [Bacteroidota bacterium]
MNNFKYIITFIAIFLTLLNGCEDRSDLTAPGKPNTGDADFTRFVSIGNSLTQGEQSGSVFASGQEYSFGNLIANQVGTSFEQLLFTDPGTGGRIEASSINPFITTINTTQGAPINLTYPAPFNNLGVKGAFISDVINTRSAQTCYTAQFGSPNPLFDAVLRGSGTQLELAIAQNPTFVTLWIGNNDILAYATRGGLFPITDPTIFKNTYEQILNGLVSTGAKVVIANIPDVTSIPFFNTVGPTLMASGTNAVVGTKADGSIALLSLTENFLTLQASAELAAGKGTALDKPLSNGVILDASEIAVAKQIVTAYNQAIAALAAAKNYPVVDINAFFTNIAANGLFVDGLNFSTQYVSGGIFSLDGVHPTSRGYGIIANEFIKVINSKYKAAIPLINVSTIPGSLVLAGAKLNKKTILNFPHGMFDNILF